MLSATAERGRRIRNLTGKHARYGLTRAEAELFVELHTDNWPGTDLLLTVQAWKRERAQLPKERPKRQSLKDRFREERRTEREAANATVEREEREEQELQQREDELHAMATPDGEWYCEQGAAGEASEYLVNRVWNEEWVLHSMEHGLGVSFLGGVLTLWSFDAESNVEAFTPPERGTGTQRIKRRTIPGQKVDADEITEGIRKLRAE